MQFLLESMKNKLILLEKQNSITINTTNKIVEQNANEIKKLLEIFQEKNLNILNLDEQLKKKNELIAKIEEKLYGIPILEHKIEVIHNDSELQKKKLNEKLIKTVNRYEGLLNRESIRNNSLNELNKSINQSLDENLFLTRRNKNLQKQLSRMKSIVKEKTENFPVKTNISLFQNFFLKEFLYLFNFFVLM